MSELIVTDNAESAVEPFREVARRVSNWGRWGAEDQRGALNLIGPQQILDAAASVRSGQIISLGIPLDKDGPLPGPGATGPGKRFNPVHIMTELGHEQRFRGDQRYADDYMILPLQCATQWDALAHIIYDGQIYNGFPAAAHITVDGASRCAIDNAAAGIVGRGVLLDVARHRNVDWLALGEVIEPEELDAVAAAQGVHIQPGDVLLIRTGWWKMYQTTRSRRAYFQGEPGLGLRCADWLHAHDIAVICADNFSIEAVAADTDGSWMSPECPDQVFILHMVATRDMGMMFGEIFDLEELADACAADGRYDFMFCAPPLRITGGVGSPINPLVVR